MSVPNAVGRVAIATAAIVADKYGWYQIYGKNEDALAGAAITADKALYLGTAGTVDDADVAGDLIKGAISRSAAGGAGSAFTVELNYPLVDDAADD